MFLIETQLTIIVRPRSKHRSGLESTYFHVTYFTIHRKLAKAYIYLKTAKKNVVEKTWVFVKLVSLDDIV